MTTYHHGITAHELTQGIMPMQNANMSTIGLIVTADDADSEMYPANTPVLLTGITKANIDNAGTQGTLQACLITMREIVNPTIIVLRITDTANVEVLEELLNCQTRLGISPKLLGAPEIDTPAMVKKMVTIAKRRRAFVYASPRREDGTLITDKSEIVAYRNQFGDRELMIIDGEFGIAEQPSDDNEPFTTSRKPSYIYLGE